MAPMCGPATGLCAFVGFPIDTDSFVVGLCLCAFVLLLIVGTPSTRTRGFDRRVWFAAIALTLVALRILWLYLHPPPPAVAHAVDDRCAAGGMCDLVVAHCKEPLAWLAPAAAAYSRVFLYTKCGADVETIVRAAANVHVVLAPNIGSNDYANLQHIIRHYDDLALLTVFCEAGMPALCHTDTVARPEVVPVVNYICDPTRQLVQSDPKIGCYRKELHANGVVNLTASPMSKAQMLAHSTIPYGPVLTQFASPPLACVAHHLKRLRLRGLEGASQSTSDCGHPRTCPVAGCTELEKKYNAKKFRYADVALSIGEYSAAGQASYTFKHSEADTRASTRFVHSGYPNMAAWMRATLGHVVATHLLNESQRSRLVLGGFFAVEAANIRRYPVQLYRTLASQQKHANEEVDHFIERLYGLLFTTPMRLPWHVAQAMLRLPATASSHTARSAAALSERPTHERSAAYRLIAYGHDNGVPNVLFVPKKKS